MGIIKKKKKLLLVITVVDTLMSPNVITIVSNINNFAVMIVQI